MPNSQDARPGERAVEDPSDVYRLDAAESELLDKVAAEVAGTYDSVEDPRFIANARLHAQRLPYGLREWLERVRFSDDIGAFRVRGHRLRDDELGATPAEFERRPREPAMVPEICLVLLGVLLGDVFGWETQQAGRLVHDVVPSEYAQSSQTSASSSAELGWHTEDAFHPHRAHYLGLACLRNPDRVPTTLTELRSLRLTERTRSVLSMPRFHHLPDTSHSPTGSDDAGAWADPAPARILAGPPGNQSLCVDADFTVVSGDDPEARAALDELKEEIGRHLGDLALEPGDYLFLDNQRCVHGRRSFRPRFDGTDRWLKRVSVTRDLRRMADAGVTATRRTARAVLSG
ncbi:guanitoxin biosynthesis L-enduracididine beta-hydroxylase GntD [Streptomyces lonegramiae]|uniref:Guanitoxin biosynthesis L-enduracididine beta-hydroxylase GntD n=1 Tax=Streptomyces lonegramiae TaxID=3075524 RepID=A0ABU2X6G1_9ACTN|nr:guanitoxin biosynthesis L-enduracididine beta-hydroxylase GntD [Streptomyces sp. DSM 41529]MDT0541503.1 guanitoxin biosynthesis L-enduracididine beta-hydroxylase GntD [Streptomyces sp. DSM 41529]